MTEDEHIGSVQLGNEFWQEYSKLVADKLQQVKPHLRDIFLAMMQDKSSVYGSKYEDYMPSDGRKELIALLKTSTERSPLVINRGWKSMDDKRGYVCRLTDDGVYVRSNFWDKSNEVFVPFEDIRTVSNRGNGPAIWDFVNYLDD